MPAYFWFDIREIKNPNKMEEYRRGVRAVVEKFGGRYIVVGGPFQVAEGTYQPVFPVMLEFPSLEQAQRWYDSEDYRDLKALRLSATTGNAFLMAGA